MRGEIFITFNRELLYLWINFNNQFIMEALRKNAANLGLFLGLTMILLTTVAYAVDLNLFTKWWFGTITMASVVVFGCISAVRNKRNAGGFLSFKETFTSFIITAVVGLFISTIYSLVLLNVIDPEAKNVITENVIKYTVDMMQGFGAKPSDINKMVEEMKNTDNFGPAGQLKGFLWNIVIYSIVGLIASLIIRRERPQSI